MNQLREVVIYNNCRRSDSIIWQVADNGSDHYGSDDIDDYADDDSPWLQKIGRYGLAGGTGKVGLRLVTNRRLRWTRSLYQACLDQPSKRAPYTKFHQAWTIQPPDQ